MSPAIKDAAIIAKMQAALKGVDLSDELARSAAYMAADIFDVEQALFDREAVRTERLRRELFNAEAERQVA